MPARFGTDGLRGVANADLSPELATALGRAVARCVPAKAFVLGRDTRRSGSMLAAALAAGVASEGADVIDLGVIPTPGVAHAAAATGLPGLVVSASHNPFEDNGIKLLAPGGLKATPELEAEVEAQLELLFADPSTPPRRPEGPAVGELQADPGHAAAYLEALVAAVPAGSCEGLKVIVDAANGAASAFAARAFAASGAQVEVINATPDGSNINAACGSTHPEGLAAAVLERGADLGLALDGDADRLIAVDASGALVDGDVVIAIFATALSLRGELPGGAVVVTTMTNLGFHRAMAERGIAVRQVDVGDRNVLRALEAEGLALGGEQSGHIVFRQRATTGDGMLTGLLLAEVLASARRPLAELAAEAMTRMPQVLVNVTAGSPAQVAELPEVLDAVAAATELLGDEGRILLRPSGTEPLVRVMVEASTDAQATELAQRVAGVVRGAAG